MCLTTSVPSFETDLAVTEMLQEDTDGELHGLLTGDLIR